MCLVILEPGTKVNLLSDDVQHCGNIGAFNTLFNDGLNLCASCISFKLKLKGNTYKRTQQVGRETSRLELSHAEERSLQTSSANRF